MNRTSQLFSGLFLLFAGVFLAQTTSNFAVAASPIVQADAHKPGWAVSSDGSFEWTTEAWTADEAPNIAIEKEIDSLIKQGKSRSAILTSSRSKAKISPSDAQSQFRWAYAAYRNHAHLEKGQTGAQVLAGIREALGAPPSPHSYRYARMRWFVTQWDQRLKIAYIVVMQRCARRFLERDPNDFDVKYTLAYDLGYNSNKRADQDDAWLWANQYITRFPQRSSGHFLMGHILDNRFWRDKKLNLAQQSIAQFKQYQKMAPKDAPNQRTAQFRIDTLQRDIESLKKKGMLKP